MAPDTLSTLRVPWLIVHGVDFATLASMQLHGES